MPVMQDDIAGISVIRESNTWHTWYTIKGKKKLVEKKIKALKSQFPPAGYNTHVRKMHKHSLLKGEWVAEVIRANSCD